MASETTSNASPSLSPLKLTEWTSCGGCAAKWGANLLKDLVDDLAAGAKPNIDPALLVGLAPFDDAAVYQVSDDVALVSTTDFFPPLVDDPDDFGAIAAANACSDVFAMGGRVVMAVNIAAFPEHFPTEAISQNFCGGFSSRRAGRWICGGWSHDTKPRADLRACGAGRGASKKNISKRWRRRWRCCTFVEASRHWSDIGEWLGERKSFGDCRYATTESCGL